MPAPSFTDELHSLSFEILVVLCEQKLFRASKMLILCFWHQYLICIFLRAVNKKKTYFPVPVAFLVSFVLLSAYFFPWETPEQSLEISTNFDEIGNSWSLGDNESVILQTPRLMHVFFTAVIISVTEPATGGLQWGHCFLLVPELQQCYVLELFDNKKSFNVFCPLDFCDRQSRFFYIVCYIFKWVTLWVGYKVYLLLTAAGTFP